MASRNKSQYFKYLRAKKAREKGQQRANATSVSTSKDSSSKQSSIASFFSPKVLKSFGENSPVAAKPFEPDNGQLKRKLDAFRPSSDDENDDCPVKRSRKSNISFAGKLPEPNRKPQRKLTPLEEQVAALRKAHPGLLLMVECGYRYRFFGPDAEVAAALLDISAHDDTVGSGLLGLTSSVPTFNGPDNYIRKLVCRGQKVGLVTQVETSAEKKVKQTENRGPFQRKVTAVYTASTFLSGDEEGNSNAILCISERGLALSLTPLTGVLVLNEFDGNSSLEHIVYGIEPSEIVVEKRGRVVDKFCSDQKATRSKNVRVEVLSVEAGDESFAENFEVHDSTLKSEWPGIAGSSAKLRVFSLLHKYLRQFGLDSSLANCSLRPSGLTGTLNLPPMTLRNLELATNSSCSLFTVLNVAKTRSGRRLLKFWMLHPLTDRGKIEERLDAVEHLARHDVANLASLRKLLGQFHFDLEAAVASAMCGRTKPANFVRDMKALAKISGALAGISWPARLPGALSERVENVVKVFAAASADCLAGLDADADAGDGPEELSLLSGGNFPAVEKAKADVAGALAAIDGHRAAVKKALGLIRFDYATVSGVEFLIEVKAKASVPDTWTPVGSTQKVVRYRSPFLAEKVPELQFFRENLAAAARAAWRAHLASLGPALRRILTAVESWSWLDVVASLAAVAQREGYCRPAFGPKTALRIERGRNVVVEHALASKAGGGQMVANDVDLDGDGKRALILTGPNMGGKSTYLRQVGLMAIMAQMGSFVPAASATMPVFDAIFVRMGARDDMGQGKSTLYVELEEASHILRSATSTSLVLLDELGRGTSTHDGTAVASATLKHLCQRIKCLTIFVTHYRDICNQQPDSARNAHMSSVNEDDSVLFMYKLCEGPSENSFGRNVAKLAGVPENILRKAKEVSERFERSAARWSCSVDAAPGHK